MRNIDRWFILIGLLYGSFGFSFGIWMGMNERFDQAHLHAHINLIGFASMILFGLLYRSYPALAASRLAALHFILFNLGVLVFLPGIPIANARVTVAFAAIGSMIVLAGLLVFLANYLLNGFSDKQAA